MSAGCARLWSRRPIALAAVVALAGWPSCQAAAQEASPLRAGEPFAVGEVKVTVLGLSISDGATGRRVVLRLRVQTGSTGMYIEHGNLRLIAGGVPRAPATFSILVRADAAEDFPVSFTIPDATNDLVLLVRVGTEVERRRLPAA